MTKRMISILLILLVVLNGCSFVREEQSTAAYKQISQEEADETEEEASDETKRKQFMEMKILWGCRIFSQENK